MAANSSHVLLYYLDSRTIIHPSGWI